jgi:hypothetical protein
MADKRLAVGLQSRLVEIAIWPPAEGRAPGKMVVEVTA